MSRRKYIAHSFFYRSLFNLDEWSILTQLAIVLRPDDWIIDLFVPLVKDIKGYVERNNSFSRNLSSHIHFQKNWMSRLNQQNTAYAVVAVI